MIPYFDPRFLLLLLVRTSGTARAWEVARQFHSDYRISDPLESKQYHLSGGRVSSTGSAHRMKPAFNCGVCILAGGLSKRMGRDKGALRLGSRTLLGRIRAETQKLDLPLRIIRNDVVAHCGPLGGIYTALKTSGAEAELFLARDMPFVSAALLQRLLGF